MTKLMPPTFSNRLLIRKRLLQSLLKEKEYPRILVITAPAGYGKTVLAQQLSHLIEKPLLWVQLDRHDNDLISFLHLLIQGLQRNWPGLGSKALQTALQDGETGNNPRLMAALLINDLIRVGAEPMLVFDDFHELNEPNVIQLFQELVNNSPAGVLSVIIGRTTPPLNLGKLYSKGVVQKLGIHDLAFSRDEITAFIKDQYSQPDHETIELIEKCTEGWPIALRLSEAIIRGKKEPLRQLKTHKNIMLNDYFASEILRQLPEDCRKFISESALLTTMTPEYCNRLLERDDSSFILKALDEKYHLLIPVEGMDNAYRLHQLLKDFLIDNLGERRSLLLRRAGNLALADGEIETALEYHLQAGFDAEAKAIFIKAAQKALKQGCWSKVNRWLDQLNEKQIAENPWLSYFRAVTRVYEGRLFEVEKWLGLAESKFTVKRDPSGLAECRLIKARILRCHGYYKKSLVLLDQVSFLNKEEAAQRFDLVLEKGYNLFLLGELPAAEKYISNNIAVIRQSGNSKAIIYLTVAMANICYQQGKHTRALQLFQWCQRAIGGTALPGYYSQDALSYIYCDWGELEKALELAEKFLAMKLRYQMSESLPSAYSNLAYVYFEMADYKKTEDLINKALELLNHYGSERFYSILNRMVLAWARLAQGHWVEARGLVDKTLSEAEKQADQVCAMVQMMAGTALTLMGEIQQAEDVLLKSEVSLEKMNFRIRLCDNYKALAYIYHTRGDRKIFQKYARKYLHLGARMNYIANKLHFTAELLKPIIRFSLERNVETLFTQCMILRLGPSTQQLLFELAEHPDPAVRQRIIAPLTELADEQLLQKVKDLAQDVDSTVSNTAHARLRLQAKEENTITRAQDLSQPEGTRLDVLTLGSLQFFLNGREISGWRTKKTRELFALLIHHCEPVDKERLRDELWPDLEPSKGNALFGTTIHYLRRKLQQEGLDKLITFKQRLYFLDSGKIHTDASEFENMINTGLQQNPLHELGAGLLGRAIRLYQDDYLADRDDYAWALPRQVYLHNLYIEALITLSRYYYSRQSYRKALDYLQKLKNADPLYETAHRLLITIHAKLGKQKALIEEHRNFRLLLMEETGLPPDQETVELFQSLTGEQ